MPATKVVTQEKLQRDRELVPLYREFIDRRNELLLAFDQGATAEDGELFPDFFTTEELVLSGKKVCKALGLNWKEIHELWKKLPATRFRHLRVYPRSSAQAQHLLAKQQAAKDAEHATQTVAAPDLAAPTDPGQQLECNSG
jgi:hypothetical protein